MKKIIISSFCIMMCLLLISCGNNNAKSIKSLNTQLDKMLTVVNTTGNRNIYDATSNEELLRQNYQNYNIQEEFNNNINKEESIKNSLINSTHTLKNKLNEIKTIDEKKLIVIDDLTTHITKYTSYLNNTKLDVDQYINKIKTNNKSNTLSSQIKLQNIINERISYLINLENTINKISIIINNEFIKNDQPIYKDNNYNINELDNHNNNELKEKIDENKKINNIDTYNNESNCPNCPQVNTNNEAYRDYNYNNTFNPNRNTDTFYPRRKNIDSYRILPNQEEYLYNENNINRKYNVEIDGELNDNKIIKMEKLNKETYA